MRNANLRRLYLSLVLAVSAATVTVLAAPPYDNFSNAGVLTNPTVATGSTVGGTKEPGEPNHAGNAGGASIWWVWTPSVSGSVTISTEESSFDTLLGVYTGTSVSTLTEVASNDDSPLGGSTSQVTFDLVAGRTYRIAVDGYGGATGSVRLVFTTPTPPDAPSWVSASDGAYTDKVRVTWGSVSGATSYEVWRGSSNVASLSSRIAQGVTSLQYDDTTAAAGSTYYYFVKTVEGSLVSLFSGGDSGYRASGPPNNNFANRVTVATGGGTVTGTTVGATKESGEPSHAGNAGGASAWWTWTAVSSGTATASTAGSGFDTLLAVYTGASVSGLTEVASNDNASGTTSQVSFTVSSGTTYQIAVDGHDGATGSVQLTVTAPWAPSAPTGLSASDGLFSDKVQVSWSTVSGATSYEVWRNTSNQSASATRIASGVTAPPYNDLTAVAGTVYYYWAKAVSTAASPFSNFDPGIRAPVNNHFAERLALGATPSVATGSNVGATKEAGEPSHAGNAGGASVWWTWTPSVSGTATITTEGSGIDTLLAVYTGTSVSALTPVASNDDAPSVTTSSVSFAITSGSTYQIVVDGKAGAAGLLRLVFTVPDPPAAPTGVAASDGIYPDRVRVTWLAAAGATSYEVWRGTSNAASLSSRIAQNVTATLYDDTTAAAGTTYYYFVKAVKGADVSLFSSPDSGYRTASGGLWGYVVRTGTSYGVAGATVSLRGTTLTTTTGDDGKYTFASAPSGNQTLDVSRNGFESSSQAITVPTSGEAQAPDVGMASQVSIIATMSSLAPGTGEVGTEALLTLTYRIANTGSTSVDVYLGASLRASGTTLTDSSDDRRVTVTASSLEYHQRTFKVPAGTPAGSYDWDLGLWGTVTAAGTFTTNLDFDTNAAAYVRSAGTTVITHGFNFWGDLTFPSWVLEMGCAIIERAGGGRVLRYQGSTGRFESDTSQCSSTTTGETVLVFDWAEDSRIPFQGYAEAAGDALFAALIDGENRGDFALSGLHFIGHSRGTVVNSEAVERLLVAGKSVGQVTNLDPHDSGAPLVNFPDDCDVNPTLSRPCTFDGGSGVVQWLGVGWGDTYYQTEGKATELWLSGRKVPGTVSVDLTALGEGHSGPAMWYLETIRDGSSEVGFAYSRIGGKARTSLVIEGTPTPPQFHLGRDGIVNGDFQRGETVFDITSTDVPGWALHGGSGGAYTYPEEVASNRYLGLTGTSASRTHNRLYFPRNVARVSFVVRVETADRGTPPDVDRLAVAIDGTPVRDLVCEGSPTVLDDLWLNTPATSYRHCSFDVSEYRGLVRPLTFEIVRGGLLLNSLVRLDNVRFVLDGTTAPGAPASVTATAGDGHATVGWTAPLSDGGASITNYLVTATPGGATCGWASGPLSCTVAELSNGTAYTFSVIATNGVGPGPASDPSSSVTPRPGVTVPGSPTGLVAVAGDAQATVSWSAPESEGGAPITSYTVSANPGGLTCVWNTGPLRCMVSGLNNGTPYIFFVTATNSAGTGPASGASSPVTPNPGVTVPGVPSGVEAVAGDAQVTVSWTAPTSNGGAAITRYTVTASAGGATCGTSGALSCTVTGLTNGTTYTFTVTAANSAGRGLASSASNAVVPSPGVTVPGAPTGVSAVAGNAQATVSWSAPASNGATITSYTATANPGGATCGTSGALSCTVTGLTNGTAYTFTVTATNSMGPSLPSSPSNAVTPSPGVTVPGAPTGVSAVAGNAEATVSWSAPASNGGATITGYSVTASPGGATCGTSGALSCTVTGLTNGTSYTFTVTATNSVGPSLPSSPSNTVTPSPEVTVPGAPAGVSAVAGNAQATVSWSAPASNGGAAITSYTVTASPSGSTCGTSGALSCTVTGLTNGTAYTFTVTATNSVGPSLPSSPSNAVTPSPGVTVPGAPTGVSAVAGNAQATVSWTAPASNGGAAITSYTVTASPGGATCGTSGALSCTVTGLTNGTAYAFTVTATNSAGTGPLSTPSNVVTPAVTDITVTATQVFPAGTPPSTRNQVASAYDVANDRLIVTGGNHYGALNNDVWVLTNATRGGSEMVWEQLAPTGTPPPVREAMAAGYDPASNRLTIHGGWPGLADTWVLTNANGLGGTPEWIHLPDAPVDRAAPVSAYDVANRRLIVFSGFDVNYYVTEACLTDVWVLSDANGVGTPTWTELHPTGPTPPSRTWASATYDATSNRLTVYGGWGADNGKLGDLWVLTHANGLGGTPEWIELTPTTGPAPRGGQSMAYDPANHRAVVAGGVSGTSPTPSGEVWLLDHADATTGTPTWTLARDIGTTPYPGNVAPAAGYSTSLSRMVVALGGDGVGYHSQTWWLDLASPLERALIAHYPLDGSGENIAGASYQGVMRNGPVAVEDRYGRPSSAMKFTQSGSQWIEVADRWFTSTTAPFSVSAWIKIENLDTDGGRAVASVMGRGTYLFYLPAEKSLAGAVRTTVGPAYKFVKSPISAPGWYHVVATWAGASAGTYRLYVNGALVGSDTFAWALNENSFTSGLAGNGYSKGEFTGVLDDVWIFGRELDGSDVSALYVAESGCETTLTPSSISVPVAGHDGTIQVATGAGCRWAATTTDSWVHTTSAGVGPGSVAYTVDANAGSSRTGRISVGGKSVTLDQAGGFVPTATIQLSTTTFLAVEGGTGASITVTRSGSSSGQASATLTVVSGTAMAGMDFNGASQTVTFGDGDSAPKTVVIPIVDDTRIEGLERASVVLSNPHGVAALGTVSEATLLIVDNERLRVNEEFASLGAWEPFGSTAPRVLPNVFGRANVFDNQGGADFEGGAVSNLQVSLAAPLVLDSSVYLDFSNPAGCYATTTAGFSYSTPTGTPPQYTRLIHAEIGGDGQACLGVPAAYRGRANLSAGYSSTEGWKGVEFIPANAFANGWHVLSIVIEADHLPSFFIDGALFFKGSVPLSAVALEAPRSIYLGSRSSGQAGKAYHDWVRFYGAVPPGSTQGRDHDGDGSADVAVYRPSTGTWFSLDSSSSPRSSYRYTGWGSQAQNDIPVVGDFDGDGVNDPAVFRPGTGSWFILNSRLGGATAWTWFGWGVSTDTLVPGDYDGDGRTDAAVYRPSTGVWYIRPSSGSPLWQIAFGEAGDIPIAGDFDGDGKRDPAVYRPSTGTWFWLKSSASYTVFDQKGWGLNSLGDSPAPGDYDGDGKTDPCVFRPGTGSWFILKSNAGYTTWSHFGWGASGDTLVPADYDGDGKTDGAIYRPSTGTWYVRPSGGAAQWSAVFGMAGDVPLVPIR